MVTTRSTPAQPTPSTTPSTRGPSTAPTAPTSAAPKPPTNVLFVCLGNICRSPMAEAVLLHTASTPPFSQRGLLGRVDSAGTGAYHAGAPPDRRTAAVLRAHGVAVPARAARMLRADDGAAFDFILAMDAENLADVRAVERRARRGEGGRRARVALFGDFGGVEGEEVGDPYYGGVDGFERAFKQCERFARGFLKALEEEMGEENEEDEENEENDEDDEDEEDGEDGN